MKQETSRFLRLAQGNMRVNWESSYQSRPHCEFVAVMHYKCFPPERGGGGDYPRELEIIETSGSNSLPMSQMYIKNLLGMP